MRAMQLWIVAVTLAGLVNTPMTMGLDDTHAIPCGDGHTFSADILQPRR